MTIVSQVNRIDPVMLNHATGMIQWVGGGSDGGGGGGEAGGEARGVVKAKAARTVNILYMSRTAYARDRKASLIPAVIHVDVSSRLQKVSKIDKPFYHYLILLFHARTGIPMIINTSFNTLSGEPIVQSP